MKLSDDLRTSIANASVSVVLRDINPETSRPLTHKETAAMLTSVAENAPHVLRDRIRHLQSQIDLLRDYLPDEVKP